MNKQNADISMRSIEMSVETFNKIGQLIELNYGLKMPPEKKVMLEARLHKRLKYLQLQNYDEYCEYLFSPQGLDNEVSYMIDVVSTNKTDFFREPHHFVYLLNNALPELLSREKSKNFQKIVLWSSACSTGEEPYTIAMVMEDFKRKYSKEYPGMDYVILATDISSKVLEKARKAIYSETEIEGISMEHRKKYLLKNRDPGIKQYRVIPELRAKVVFHRLNLMDDNFGIQDPIDVIFCRNVMIYFRRPIQEKLMRNFSRYMSPDAYIFIGHSETLINMDLPFYQLAPTIYRRRY